ncbi:MAG: peptidase M23 [Gammaproteobacteria bacterium]|nr:MAG: peptidase M23 [Gammaproteobacteria bacterium]
MFRRGLQAAGACALVAAIAAPFFSGDDKAENAGAASLAVNFQQPGNNDTVSTNAEPTATLEQKDTELPAATTEATPETPLTWTKQMVRSGDNLTAIFKRVMLSAADVHRLMTSSPLAKSLTRMKPGEELSFAFAENGTLAQLNYVKSRLESYTFKAAPEEHDSAFIAEHVIREPEISTAYRQATIEDSLFLAGERAQLPHKLIMEIANIFGWDVDFALDIRKGDHFALLYEEKYLDGEKIGSGNILAAEFTNQGRTFKAVRYVDSEGRANYYTPEGFSMRKAFLRAPLDFTRISSNFNLRRKHPIHKSIRAHRGVDYAAPRGTPIFAAGDGKVIASSYNKANGNYVFIQHGQRYTTKYLHLNKRSVKKGQLVRQRQVIGTLGSTGYATGPHLHYEFLVNGVHQNPRTVSLPQALPIDDAERIAFNAATAVVMDKLALHQQSTQLAMLSEKESQQRATQ